MAVALGRCWPAGRLGHVAAGASGGHPSAVAEVPDHPREARQGRHRRRRPRRAPGRQFRNARRPHDRQRHHGHHLPPGPGELVKAGDVVVQFDTTTQEYNLREAQADLAEAEQQVIQAQATADRRRENNYTVLSAQSDVKLAQLEVRRNPLLPSIRRQNDIALLQAQNRLRQATRTSPTKSATNNAGIAIQQAA